MKLANIILSVITLALSVYIYYVSRQFPEVLDSVPGPGIWPGILSLCLFGVSLFLLVTTIITWKKPLLKAVEKTELSKDRGQTEERIFSGKGTIRVYILMGIALIYLVLMMLVGFLISSAIFMIVTMLFMGEKRIWLAALVGVGASLGLYLIFFNVFRILLPAGALFR